MALLSQHWPLPGIHVNPTQPTVTYYITFVAENQKLFDLPVVLLHIWQHAGALGAFWPSFILVPWLFMFSWMTQLPAGAGPGMEALGAHIHGCSRSLEKTCKFAWWQHEI
jgi:hypothetical protein